MSVRPLRRRLWPFATIVAGLVVTLAAVALGRGPTPPATSAPVPSRTEALPAGEDTAPRPVDPSAVRDVFRFAEAPRPATRLEPSPRIGGEPTPSPGPAGPRLVGLVRQAGRLMAALSVDGEVELAGDGDHAAGVTVLSVGEEGVRVRLADGTEQTLALP